MVREAAEGIALTMPWEDECIDIEGAPSLEIIDNGQSYGTNRFTLLAVLQSQAARFSVRLRPFQADHLAATAAGQRKLTNDVRNRDIFLLLGGVAEHPTE